MHNDPMPSNYFTCHSDFCNKRKFSKVAAPTGKPTHIIQAHARLTFGLTLNKFKQNGFVNGFNDHPLTMQYFLATHHGKSITLNNRQIWRHFALSLVKKAISSHQFHFTTENRYLWFKRHLINMHARWRHCAVRIIVSHCVTYWQSWTVKSSFYFNK